MGSWSIEKVRKLILTTVSDLGEGRSMAGFDSDLKPHLLSARFDLGAVCFSDSGGAKAIVSRECELTQTLLGDVGSDIRPRTAVGYKEVAKQNVLEVRERHRLQRLGKDYWIDSGVRRRLSGVPEFELKRLWIDENGVQRDITGEELGLIVDFVSQFRTMVHLPEIELRQDL